MTNSKGVIAVGASFVVALVLLFAIAWQAKTAQSFGIAPILIIAVSWIPLLIAIVVKRRQS